MFQICPLRHLKGNGSVQYTLIYKVMEVVFERINFQFQFYLLTHLQRCQRAEFKMSNSLTHSIPLSPTHTTQHWRAI